MEQSALLNLWKKELVRVPDSVWEQTELRTLVLADNALSEVSEQIGRLKKLRTLDLGHNKLTRVPDALAELEGLAAGMSCHGGSAAPRRHDGPLPIAPGEAAAALR